MMFMICKKCGYQVEEPGMLSQSLWVWPVFGAFPGFFLAYYCYAVTQDWSASQRWIATIAVFVLILCLATYLLRRYCRSLEYEHLRHIRCPECRHTQWEYREAKNGKGTADE